MVSTTGTRNSRPSSWASIEIPFRCASSIMFRQSTIGRPISRSSSVSSRLRLSSEASTTLMIKSTSEESRKRLAACSAGLEAVSE